MTLQRDIADWSATRHDWQKAAIARFCRDEDLTPEDIAGIADQLIASTHPTYPSIVEGDVPGVSASGQAVQLSSVTVISGINALIPNQTLTLNASGLTLVYGDNGSGKSSYARLIRQAVNARVKADLLGNVFQDTSTEKRATFAYSVGRTSAVWALGDTHPKELSAIQFFDEACGDAYVTKAAETRYRPSALTLLDRLSRACDVLRQELDRRLAVNAASRPELPLIPEGTSARRFLDALTAETTETQVDHAAGGGEDERTTLAQKLQELARLQKSEPAVEKSRLAKVTRDWQTVKNYLERLGVGVGATQLEELRQTKARAHDLRTAAIIASDITFETDPLDGVGSATWRTLWEAARNYSTEEAYHEHDYPAIDDGAVCVLCQQAITPEGADRLTRFESFIQDTTSRDAEAAEKAFGLWRQSMLDHRTLSTDATLALGRLQTESEDTTVVELWIAQAVGVASEAVNWIDGTRIDLPQPPHAAPLEHVAARLRWAAQTGDSLDETSYGEQVQALAQEVAELQGRIQILAAKTNILEEVNRLKLKKSLELARRLTETTGITRKATALSTQHVTVAIRDHFLRETERLSLRKVTLDPTGGRRDATLEHRPALLGARVHADINSVLSEGEQTALGLAGFLTEVAFDASKSAVVLDDPVSSLDAGRRSRVATRLIELARDRQVVIFTHDVAFVTALNKTARDLGVEVTHRTIQRQGEQPGQVADKHPWNVKDISARVEWLTVELGRLRREHATLDSEDYTQRAQLWGGRLSQAWERAVNLSVVNELVDRGTNEVRPLKFRIVASVTEADNLDFQSGYAKASEWAPRHDQAPEVNFVAPEPDELQVELTRFTAWTDRVKRYGR